ncbi:hypothetical protein TNCV_4322611 [Trichonephila clavipes]|uniref:Uncharacterized protein n=1 Tax=Trichonephila clavipes TaxID=2585209 RepID=A0A8X6SDS7_TRICX|nr:hypothetical protein TNCV_4322611 [Trichonephila clavipes]
MNLKKGNLSSQLVVILVVVITTVEQVAVKYTSLAVYFKNDICMLDRHGVLYHQLAPFLLLRYIDKTMPLLNVTVTMRIGLINHVPEGTCSKKYESGKMTGAETYLAAH